MKKHAWAWESTNLTYLVLRPGLFVLVIGTGTSASSYPTISAAISGSIISAVAAVAYPSAHVQQRTIDALNREIDVAMLGFDVLAGGLLVRSHLPCNVEVLTMSKSISFCVFSRPLHTYLPKECAASLRRLFQSNI